MVATQDSKKPPTRVSVLGSTGSIGTQTLEVLRSNPGRFEVVCLTAHRNLELLTEQILEFKPRFVVVSDLESVSRLEALKLSTTVLHGEEALLRAVDDEAVEIVVVAIVGFAALLPVMRAIDQGKRIALANKECLVTGGELVMNRLRASSSILVPVDSEHNSIFQAQHSRDLGLPLHSITLTASGGPFRELPKEEFSSITPEQAIRHPRWAMGRKISVDSATLMNKGLEVIEAAHLFSLPAEKIKVLIHPQSVLHGMVEYADGSSVGVLYPPSMKVPIAHALFYLESKGTGLSRPLCSDNPRLELTRLDFFEVDHERFPSLNLCYAALKAGGRIPTILNAGNEVAVEAFLNAEISFTTIPVIIEKLLEKADSGPLSSLEELLEVDRLSRIRSVEIIQTFRKRVFSIQNLSEQHVTLGRES